MATIGVLITYYNEKNLLTECINSLLAEQSLPDEILVYDDAAQFPAKDYVPVGSPVRVIRGEKNRGPAYGRNELLRESQADYVHFQDADDLFLPDWSSKVREVIETQQPDIVFTEIVSRDAKGNENKAVIGLGDFSELRDLINFAITGILLIPSSTFKRDLGIQIGGLRTREVLPQSEDFDFHVRLVNKVSRFQVIQEPLICQRLRANSHSSANQEACWYSMIKAASLLIEEVPEPYHPALVEIAAKYASTLYQAGHKEEARWGFQVANNIGTPSYIYKNRLYRLLAKNISPEVAEQVSALYRTLLPQKFRQYFQKSFGN